MIGLPIEAVRVGDHAEITRQVTAQDVADFVDAVGDHNPIHSDPEYAASTVFKEPIAPGMWTAGLISAVIGTRLPGPGAVYLSQSLKFLKPVRLGDVVTARVEVLETVPEKSRMRLCTVCTNQHGEEVLVGEAVVKASPTRVLYARTGEGGGPLAMWALAPWAWLTQSAAVLTMLGVSALAGAAAGITGGPDASRSLS